MQGMISRVQRFLISEDGPTAVEYAVMLALILVACITIVTTLGKSISSTFNTVNTSLALVMFTGAGESDAAVSRKLFGSVTTDHG